MHLVMPKLYVILDAAVVTGSIQEIAEKLMEAGVRLLQYRDKQASSRDLYENARVLAASAERAGCRFIVNDRADVAYLAGATGIHIGQEDIGAEQARRIMGPERWVGCSTHNLEQFEKAASTSADYIAVGPIFATSSKANPDPVVGLELLGKVRKLTKKPIVAIGGITVETAEEVLAAGADSVAVISDVLRATDPARRVQEYLRRLEAVKTSAGN